jgi:hypothetical protein
VGKVPNPTPDGSGSHPGRHDDRQEIGPQDRSFHKVASNSSGPVLGFDQVPFRLVMNPQIAVANSPTQTNRVFSVNHGAEVFKEPNQGIQECPIVHKTVVHRAPPRLANALKAGSSGSRMIA